MKARSIIAACVLSVTFGAAVVPAQADAVDRRLHHMEMRHRMHKMMHRMERRHEMHRMMRHEMRREMRHGMRRHDI